MTTLTTTGAEPTVSGAWIQVSRLGMPLTNEVVIPLGAKDRWNAGSPYTGDLAYAANFMNPELALYMDASAFGSAVPGLSALRIQTASLGTYDFRNTHMGLWPLKGTPAVAGTALDDAIFGTILLPNASSPRSVDILPIFYTGVPNLAPYHLATGKGGNPLANGKPFVNNFLPITGDMLRLNMAVPVTSRTDPKFSSLGLVQAAVLGLTDPAYNATSALQFIPNMDGFPNGRRLEDDVTTIELQAVSGVVLAAIGLWYDDYSGTGSPVTTQLTNVLGFNAGVTKNDTTFKACFPYVQQPWQAFTGPSYTGPTPPTTGVLGLAPQLAVMSAYPNPFADQVTFRYKMNALGSVKIEIYNIAGRVVNVANEGYKSSGDYTHLINTATLPAGDYIAILSVNEERMQTAKLVKVQ